MLGQDVARMIQHFFSFLLCAQAAHSNSSMFASAPSSPEQSTLVAPEAPVYLGEIGLDSGVCLIGGPVSFLAPVARSDSAVPDFVRTFHVPANRVQDPVVKVVAESLSVYMVQNDANTRCYELRAFPQWESDADAEPEANTYDAAQRTGDDTDIKNKRLQQKLFAHTNISVDAGAVVFVDAGQAADHAISTTHGPDNPESFEHALLRIRPVTWTPCEGIKVTLTVLAVGNFQDQRPVKFYRIIVAQVSVAVPATQALPFLATSDDDDNDDTTFHYSVDSGAEPSEQ
jgi:hypothetical protein